MVNKLLKPTKKISIHSHVIVTLNISYNKFLSSFNVFKNILIDKQFSDRMKQIIYVYKCRLFYCFTIVHVAYFENIEHI